MHYLTLVRGSSPVNDKCIKGYISTRNTIFSDPVRFLVTVCPAISGNLCGFSPSLSFFLPPLPALPVSFLFSVFFLRTHPGGGKFSMPCLHPSLHCSQTHVTLDSRAGVPWVLPSGFNASILIEWSRITVLHYCFQSKGVPHHPLSSVATESRNDLWPGNTLPCCLPRSPLSISAYLDLPRVNVTQPWQILGFQPLGNAWGSASLSFSDGKQNFFNI